MEYLPIIIDTIHCGYVEKPPGGWSDRDEMILFGRLALEKGMEQLPRYSGRTPQECIHLLTKHVAAAIMGPNCPSWKLATDILVAYTKHHRVYQRFEETKDAGGSWLPDRRMP